MNTLRRFFTKPLGKITSKFARQMQNGTENITAQHSQSFGNSVGYLEKISKHRMFLPVYDLVPQVSYLAWVAPNSTLSTHRFYLSRGSLCTYVCFDLV